MATYSEVKSGLDDISAAIRAAKEAYDRAKVHIQGASDSLGNIPTTYSDVITEVNGYTPTGAFETLAKDEKAKLQAEFQALKATIDALTATTEFSA